MRRENKLTGKAAISRRHALRASRVSVLVSTLGLVAFLAVLVLAAAMPAQAQAQAQAELGATFGTGERLYSWCVSKEKAKQDLCAAYLGGITDVLAFGPVGAYRACIPQDEVKFSQIKDVMRTWLIKNQEKLHYSAVALAARALSEAYPCKQ